MDGFLCESRRPSVLSLNGSVACEDTRAAQIGLDVLRAGGNAADAAVATAAALSVTLPMSCGIGGDAFCLFYDAKTKKVRALNGSGRSSAGMSLDFVKSKGIDKKKGWQVASGMTVTVPGAPAAFVDTLDNFGSGKLSHEDLFKPAIDLAEKGFAVNQIAAYFWEKGSYLLRSESNPHGESLLINGQAPKWGEVFYNPDLGHTYRKIAKEGKSGYYKGEVAEAIVQAVTSNGGVITPDDLANHKSTIEDPVSTEFNGVRLWECGPNGQGMIALMALNILKAYDLKSMRHNCPEYLHHLIEALRLSFSDGINFIADPMKREVPVDAMLSDDYAAKRRKFISPKKAMQEVPCSNLSVGKDTTYLTVADKDGNACSFIFSNYMGFGTGIVPRGCGFTLQNRGANFSLDENCPNVIAPGKRPYHTIIPAMITDDKTGDFMCSYGVMGGFMQPQGHIQVLLNMLLYGMHPQKALDQPRFCIGPGHKSPVGSVSIEEGIPESVIAELKKLGHDVQGPVCGHERALFGRGHVITRGAWWSRDSSIKNDSSVLWAGSDKRADGAAVGY